LLSANHAYRLVIEPDNSAAALLVGVEKGDSISDRHRIAPKPLRRLRADLDVGAVQVDGRKAGTDAGFRSVESETWMPVPNNIGSSE
jgi:hypothetical protein